MENAGNACKYRLYRHIRTYKRIIKIYIEFYLKNVASLLPVKQVTAAPAGCIINYVGN